jgi:sugar/nucleoside kinase (ribokinase family)
VRGLFIGLATVDLIYSVDGYPREDTKTTAVGRHPLAEIIQSDLAKYCVQLHDVDRTSEAPPAVSSIIVNQIDGSRTVISIDATRRVIPGDAFDREFVEGQDVALVDLHQPNLALLAAKEAARREAPVIVDAGRWREGTGDLMSHVEVAICSEQFRPPGTDSSQQVLDRLMGWGVKHAAISRGDKPTVYASQGGAQGELAVPSVPVVDTLGAGDFLHGAFAYFYQHSNHDFVNSLREAAEIASESCRHFGTRQWIEDRDIGVER